VARRVFILSRAADDIPTAFLIFFSASAAFFTAGVIAVAIQLIDARIGQHMGVGCQDIGGRFFHCGGVGLAAGDTVEHAVDIRFEFRVSISKAASRRLRQN